MPHKFDLFSLLQPPEITSTLLLSLPSLLSASLSLRLVLLLYGIRTDTQSALKYTDIDYLVFTDASRALSRNLSPYARDTYRYTPLLAHILLPTTWEPQWIWFHYGKVVFALADVAAGWFLYRILLGRGMRGVRARGFAALWLLNPLVAVISTRGSSEGLLCALVLGVLWAVETKRVALAGALLGLAVHFKIYPFVYGVSILWALEEPTVRSTTTKTKAETISDKVGKFMNPARLTLLFTSLATFSLLNLSMFFQYGYPFIKHTYLHHVTRLDHRHNFSVYNTLLYLSSAAERPLAGSSSSPSSSFSPASLAFIPQLLLSVILIPLTLAKSPINPNTGTRKTTITAPPTSTLPLTLFAQTLTFTTFNKVLTSQYFLWSLVFLPLILPTSTLLHRPRLGFSVLAIWILTQATWLFFAYRLEMQGKSSFLALWLSGIAFFASGCWILGIVVADQSSSATESAADAKWSELKGKGPPGFREKSLADEGVFSDSASGEENEDEDGSSVEEIVREVPVDVSVQEMVDEELRRRREVEKGEILRGYVEEMEKLM